MSREQITAERLRELLSYDPETGTFRWNVTRGGTGRAGSVAGCIDETTGYRRICIDGRRYYAHRLAWFYMTGEWPVEEIDHRNTVRGDDRWENLREASHAGNRQNSGKRRTNTSGLKGVSWHAGASKWMAKIQVNGRQVYLGLFTNIDAAAAAYTTASERLHGEFGRTG